MFYNHHLKQKGIRACRGTIDTFQDYAVNLWLNGGTPKEKLILGLGLYGRSFKMGSSSYALGSSAAGGGAAGRYTGEAGFLSFYEVSDKDCLDTD